MSISELLNFNEKGLIPAIIQDYKTGKVLTLCYMNKDALERTMQEGKIYVFRRSKNRIMLKGETSGNVQLIKELFLDCSGNSLLFKVEQKIAACHKGYFTCYFRKLDENGSETVVEKRIFDPEDVYKNKL
ncbi:MAG: phosphoribosyl-AMP cyclohydrolase [Candidatus Omnitrophica bacterium]|nr:phosphoribosyl-AMP cyclohydrolase [Candidatus Omnitrophota bacterium]